MGANAQTSRSLPEYGDDVGIHNCNALSATPPSLRTFKIAAACLNNTCSYSGGSHSNLISTKRKFGGQ